MEARNVGTRSTIDSRPILATAGLLTAALLGASPALALITADARVNINGPATTGTDYPGAWDADAGAVCDGSAFTAAGDINGTADDDLFRGGMSAPTINCSLGEGALPNGNYTVRLYFAELFFGCPGEGSSGGAGARVFDVAIEGRTVLRDFDIYAEAGGCALSTAATVGVPVVKSFPVTITDGALDIDMAASVSAASIAAIELFHGDAQAFVTITPNAAIDGSTYGGHDAFKIENTSRGGEKIVGVRFDLSTSFLPDIVFDPEDGTPAGDTTNKCLDPDGVLAASTGYVYEDPDCDAQPVGPFSRDRDNGYDVAALLFDPMTNGGFEPGETFTFSVDIDPTSIQGAQGAGGAGSVSGFELSGGTVAVEFDTGELYATSLFKTPGSDGGSQALVASLGPVAPIAEDLAQSAVPAVIAQAARTFRVTTGAPGDRVRLVVVEAELTSGSAFDIDPFEANSALAIRALSGTTGQGGHADFNVQLSGPAGNIHHVFAALEDSAVTGPAPHNHPRTSPISNVLILTLDPTACDAKGRCDAEGAELNTGPEGLAKKPPIGGIEVSAVDNDGILGASDMALSLGLVDVDTRSAPYEIALTNLGVVEDADIAITHVEVSGEFDSTLVPQTLAPGQSIVFEVTFRPTMVGLAAGTVTIAHDGNNAPFTVNLFGGGVDGNAAPIGFKQSELQGESSQSPTSLDFAPDGRLFTAQQNGLIHAYTVERFGPADYRVADTETIDRIKAIPNHDDDGTPNSGQDNRQVTGLLATACPADRTWCTEGNTVLYVSSSDPRINNGDLDTNSGIISRLAWNGIAWDHVQIVRGLPRSKENHSTNGMAITEDHKTLYVMSGGHDNKGAPSDNFEAAPSYALSAAMLSVDLGAIEGMPITADGSGGRFVYDIPTLDDPTRPGNPDPGDPFGGNSGRNQARIVPGGPVQVFSPGYRNAYDMVIATADLDDDGQSDNRIYTFDNGPNVGRGGLTVGEGTEACTNAYNEAASESFGDSLHYVSGPGYYGGHPNPTRGNPADSDLIVYEKQGGAWVEVDAYDWEGPEFGSAPPVPFGTGNAVECDYRIPGLENNALTVIGSSTNGIAEYTASNFGGAMLGDLLAVSFNGILWRFQLNAHGDRVAEQGALARDFAALPLDVAVHADDDTFPGTIWVAAYGSENIVVFEPDDFNDCAQPGDAATGRQAECLKPSAQAEPR